MGFAMIGLGRMGANMARRLRRADIPVAAYNRKPAVTRALAMETGLVAADSMEQLVGLLESPRAIWLMLPEGEVTQAHIDKLASLLDAGDLVIDGGNSFYKDSIARARVLGRKGILFVDAGVSGGIWGLESGYALMVGGQTEAVEIIAPILRVLAPGPEQGWLHCGPPGSGHFVKMVHNGMEHGMVQAYAESFALLKGRMDFDLDLAAIAEMWRHGSVVRSWPSDLTARILQDDRALDDIEAFLIMNETQPC